MMKIENADNMKSESMWMADLKNGNFMNPILYQDFSDPDAIRVGEDYYMIASSFCNAPGVPVLHSKDLVNWKLINYVWDKIPDDRYEKVVHGCGAWAPSIRYHEGTFYACVPMPDEGIYMSTTKDPFSKWSEPVNIRPGAGWIDPCPFWDEDGRAYLVAGVAKSRIGYKSVLHMVEMAPDGLSLIGEEKVVFDGNLNDQVTIEGPKMYKYNGWYYIFAPAGGVKVGWQTVLRSKNVFGPYEYKVVLRQGDTMINGPHQGAWVDTVTGENYFIHFQDVYAAGRITHLQPMTFVNDWPVIGVAKNGNEYGEPVAEFKKPNVGKVYDEVLEPETSDDFTGEKLSLQWQWNANYKNEWYECTDNGLVLNAVTQKEYSCLADVPNLLLQKWPAPEFKCVYKMDVSGLDEGDEAGIISLGMKYAGLCINKKNDNLYIKKITGSLKFNGQEWDSIEEEAVVKECKNNVVWFMYEVKRTGYKDLNEEEKHIPVENIDMYISMDGSNFEKLVSIEAVAGRWVGVKNGMYCINNALESKGKCKVLYAKYFK